MALHVGTGYLSNWKRYHHQLPSTFGCFYFFGSKETASFPLAALLI
jgi:hypothetical protein